MFIVANQCLICEAPWEEGSGRCTVCGSVNEIYFEHSLPKPGSVDREIIQQNIDRVRTILIKHENDAVARYSLALSYINLGLLPEGTTELKKAAQLLPEKTEIAYEVAAMEAKQGDSLDEILHRIDRVIERQPALKEAVYLKGVILNRRGETEEAIRVWQSAYALDADYQPPRKALDAFISANRKLLTNQQIVRAMMYSGLTRKEQNYLELLAWTGRSRPPELGKTSMQLLESISPTRANKMRKIHAAKVQEYEELDLQRSKLTAVMEADVVTLSDLCLRAQKARTQLKQEAVSQLSTTKSSGSVSDRGRLSIEERSAILERAIQNYQKQGYKLVSRTETTAQLSKQHEFSCCIAFFLVLIVIGIILYLLYYLTANKEHFVFLEVDEYGKVHTSQA